MSGATPPSAKKQKIDLSDTYTLIVGEEKKEMIVHKDVLQKSSRFFAACCGGSRSGTAWKEQKDKTINLPDEDPEVVHFYVSWLYTGELAVIDEGIPTDPRDHSDVENDRLTDIGFDRLFRLAVLSDKFGDDSFANTIVDNILTVSDTFWLSPALTACCSIYDELPEASPIRRLLRDFCLSANPKTLDKLKRHRGKLPHDFIFDMLIESMRRQRQAEKHEPSMRTRCEYHIHDDNTPKCK